MSVKLGTVDIKNLKLGSSRIAEIMVGTSHVFGPDTSVPFWMENPDSQPHDAIFTMSGNSGISVDLYYSYSPLHTTSGGTIHGFDGTDFITTGNHTTVNLPAQSKVYFYIDGYDIFSDGFHRLSDGNDYILIDCSDLYNIGGNIMSLLYGNEFTGRERSFDSGSRFEFYSLFNSSINLEDASELILPSTVINPCCYESMFEGCASLTQAPVLPAVTLDVESYQAMFNGCTSLSNVTCFAENVSATNCTAKWLNGVAPKGTFTKSVTMASWTTGINGIPSGWTTVNV